jgi:DNA-directed RNA polymerase subunit RPC12/RpoP
VRFIELSTKHRIDFIASRNSIFLFQFTNSMLLIHSFGSFFPAVPCATSFCSPSPVRKPYYVIYVLEIRGYCVHPSPACRRSLGVGPDMPRWELECANCKNKFTHSTIDDTGMLNYFLPLKPPFPSGGSEFECPNCGHKSTYQRTDLIYRA